MFCDDIFIIFVIFRLTMSVHLKKVMIIFVHNHNIIILSILSKTIIVDVII